MQLFRERGVVPHYREGMFLDASWLAVYFGQNIFPRHYDPLSNRVADDELARHLAGLSNAYAAAVDTMPEHREFLRQLGAVALQ
jgi:tryptophan halogenase